MEPIKFKYSAGQTIWEWALFACVELGFCVSLFGGHHQIKAAWLIFSILTLLISARLVYQSIYLYIPCLKGSVAIELDDEKIQFFIKSLIPFYRTRPLIFWKDIEDIDFVNPPRFSAVLNFNLKDGDTVSLPLKNVSGFDKFIYEKVQESFEKSKKK